MSTICRATEYVNPGLIPVFSNICITKLALQCKFCDTDIAEDKFLIMPGVMRTEEMVWTTSGDWLECSGWTTAIQILVWLWLELHNASLVQPIYVEPDGDGDKTGRRAAQIQCTFHCKSSLGNYTSQHLWLLQCMQTDLQMFPSSTALHHLLWV